MRKFQQAICGFIIFPLLVLAPGAAYSDPQTSIQLSTFGAGTGPSHAEGVYRLLDGKGTFDQSNAIAFPPVQSGAFEQITIKCQVRVLAGGDGGAFALLNTAEYGKNGPAPFLKNWAEPNLTGSFGLGIDVHNPPADKRVDQWGNYLGMPEREISLHWDGQEIANRVANVDFPGDFVDLEITTHYVIGGAEVSVSVAGEAVYERYLIPGMLPYEARLLIGAGTREKLSTEFDVRELSYTSTTPARPRRQPKHFQLFNHVMTSHQKSAYKKEVTLPPLDWAFGRVILTLEIHDAGPNWNPWDQIGSFSVIGSDGVSHDIAPFITSFRTPARWQVDVTAFRPWLTGKVSFEIGTTASVEDGRGYMLGSSLDFYHGTPDLESFRIVPLWEGKAKYTSADNHYRDFFTPKTVKIDPMAQAARLYLTTTGHSPVGEFTPARRKVIFIPEIGSNAKPEKVFKNTLWKTDCYLNPVRPQLGTWKYARAGWAPGDIVRPWWIDLTPDMIPGKTAGFRYEPEPYDFSAIPLEQRPTEAEISSAIQMVHSYLILFRTPTDLIPAPAIEVLEVEPESNAEKNGIKAGDYLVSYDGQYPDTIDELLDVIETTETVGKKRIEVVVYRGSSRLTLELESGRMGVKIAEEVAGH